MLEDADPGLGCLRTPIRDTLETPIRDMLEAPLRDKLEAPIRDTLEAPIRDKLVAPTRGIGRRSVTYMSRSHFGSSAGGRKQGGDQTRKQFLRTTWRR